MNKYEKTVNTFITNRFDYLLTCAFNSLKRIGRTDLARELVSECYMYLINNKDKLQNKIADGKIEAIAVQFMFMQVFWNKTDFKKTHIEPSKVFLDLEFVYKDDKEESTLYAKILNSIFIYNDEIDEEEYLEKEKEKQDKINSIQQFVTNATIQQKILFDLFFNKGYNSSHKLAKYTGISKTGCNIMMNQLKEQIRDSYYNKTKSN